MKPINLVIVGLATIGSAFIQMPEAQADHCSRLDFTCPASHRGTCNLGAGNCNGGSGGETRVPQDQTPPQVRTARDLLSRGYRCVDITEYPDFTCSPPGGMDSSTFSWRREAFRSTYIGGNADWAWNCLNNRGQLWGTSNGNLLCQPNMR